jgi:carbon-monoxide dehydrogenase small subunit
MDDHCDVEIEINGERVRRRVPARTSLVDFLRNDLELTGSHVGCEHGVCGACTVLIDGEIARGCLVLAAQASGARVRTIEGLSEAGEIADLQAAFHERNASQCGFCSPGMLVTAQDLLQRNPSPSRTEIRDAISANYCRCTGYEAIVDAIERTAASRSGRTAANT